MGWGVLCILAGMLVEKGLQRRTYGVMQGRLSPPEDGRFQSFPRESWRAEFARARAAGLDYIEWIYDEYGASANPLSTDAGMEELNALQQEHGVGVPAVCADWFMDFPLIRCDAGELARRMAFLGTLFQAARRIGAERLVLPFLDQSRVENETEERAAVAAVKEALKAAEATGVELHLEADFGPRAFAAFLEKVPHPLLKVNWDSGNSSGLGYVAREEFAAYGERIGSVHIKDRYRKPEGGVETRPLGTGSADFEDVFGAMRGIGFAGGVTLQVARGRDGEEVEWLRDQLAFVHRHWPPAVGPAAPSAAPAVRPAAPSARGR